MLLESTPELEIPAKRGKTLLISVLVHVVLVAILWLEPGLFDSNSKRVIRIEGNDYDVTQLTELDLAPTPRPVGGATPRVGGCGRLAGGMAAEDWPSGGRCRPTPRRLGGRRLDEQTRPPPGAGQAGGSGPGCRQGGVAARSVPWRCGPRKKKWAPL